MKGIMKEKQAAYIVAAEDMDWMQVVLNQGPPCFHLQSDGRFCGRAERWAGHDGKRTHHSYVPLHELLKAYAKESR